MTENKQQKIGNLLIKYVLRNATANIILGVDIIGDFYKTALLAEIENTTGIEMGPAQQHYIHSILNNISENKELYKKCKNLDFEDSIQYINMCNDISNKIQKLNK